MGSERKKEMKAVQIDFVRRMLLTARNESYDEMTIDEIINSIPCAVEDMVLESRYNKVMAEKCLNKEKVELLLDVIKELG